MFVNQRKEGSMCGIIPSTDGDMGKAALFHSLFPHVLEIAQPDFAGRDSSVIGFFFLHAVKD